MLIVYFLYVNKQDWVSYFLFNTDDAAGWKQIKIYSSIIGVDLLKIIVFNSKPSFATTGSYNSSLLLKHKKDDNKNTSTSSGNFCQIKENENTEENFNFINMLRCDQHQRHVIHNLQFLDFMWNEEIEDSLNSSSGFSFFITHHDYHNNLEGQIDNNHNNNNQHYVDGNNSDGCIFDHYQMAPQHLTLEANVKINEGEKTNNKKMCFPFLTLLTYIERESNTNINDRLSAAAKKVKELPVIYK